MTRRQQLVDRLARREASLALAEATYNDLLNTGVESYRFNSTEGEQQAKRRKLNEIKRQIDELTSEIDSLQRKLNGGGLVNLGLRRR